MKTIIKISIIIILGVTILSIPKIKEYINYFLNIPELNEETEEHKIIPPQYDIGVINDILETAVLEQTISVIFDTVLPVKKTYHLGVIDMIGYHKPILRTNTEARLYYEYDFLVKAGYKIEKSDVLQIKVLQIDDTIWVTLPPPKILTVELQNTINKLEDVNTNNKLIINKKYITQTQRNETYKYVKQLAINKLYKNNILNEANKIGKQKIQNFLQTINKNYIIIVRSYGEK